MHELDVSLYHGKRTVDVGKLGVGGRTLCYNKNKHPVVGLMPTMINEEIPASFVAFAQDDVEKTQCSGKSDNRDRSTTLEDIFDQDWSDPEEAYYGVVKKGVKKRLKNFTQVATEEATKTTTPRTPRPHRKFKILEIFTWSIALSTIACSIGWDVMEPVDLMSGWDLTKAGVRKKAYEYVQREKPDLVVVALPFTYF